MPNNQINAKIVSRNDSKTNWTTNNPKPLKGELCIEFDPNASSNTYTVKAKVGDGVNYYNDLPYLAGEMIADEKSITNDDGEWKIFGFDDAEHGQFPVKKVSNNVESIDWVSLGTAATKNVPTQGNASDTEVVMGNDTRLNSVRYDTAVQGLTDTQKSNARTNIGAGTSSFSGDYGDLSNKPTIPSTAADVGALPDSTKYGASLSLSIDPSTYVVTATLKDQDGNRLGTDQTIDLPLETVVVGGSYDPVTQKVILTLKNGDTIEFSVADLVSGLQTEITSSNMLSADLVDDANATHKFTSTAEKSKLSNIEAGAEVNTIEGVALNGTTLLPDSTTKIVNIQIASTSALGVVKSSASNADNKVEVEAGGTMKVNAVTTDILKNGNNTLVFICGDSSS